MNNTDNVNTSLPSPSQIVSEVHYQYHQTKSPTKPRIFLTNNTSPKLKKNKNVSNTEYSKLNLHGVNLLKHQPTYIANLIWDGTNLPETHKNEYIITPKQSRINTANIKTYSSHNSLSLLTNPIQITHLNTPKDLDDDDDDNDNKDIGNTFTTPNTIYLKMSTLEDCTISRKNDELCDYQLYSSNPKHNARITKMLKKKQQLSSSIYPTKSFKKMNHLTVNMHQKRTHQSIEMLPDDDDHHKFISYFKHLNNHKLMDDKNNKINSKECHVFDINRKQFVSKDILPINHRLFPNIKVESTVSVVIPYKKSTLSMRNDCMKFRKKWS